MATAAPIAANQNNSTCTSHGLSGAFTVLAHEEQEEFDILLVYRRDDFQPATGHETFFVELMAPSRWRIATLPRYALAAERSHYKAHAEFIKSRKIRNEVKAVVEYGEMDDSPPRQPTAPGENLALRL